MNIDKMVKLSEEVRRKTEATAPPASWFSVSNNAETGAVTVRIYDEIGGWGVDAADFAEEIGNIRADAITVALNSPGGSVFDGLAIYSTLRNHPARITVRVDGLAASAASFIAQAGDSRIMSFGSQMMIHDARAVVAGDAETLRYAADFLEKQSINIAEIYAERSGMHDAAHYAEMMAVETWMSADEAVAAGLADEVLAPPARAAADKSPVAATDDAAASAAASVQAAQGEQQGERAAFLRKIHLSTLGMET